MTRDIFCCGKESKFFNTVRLQMFTYTHPYKRIHAHLNPMSTSKIPSQHNILRLTKSSEASARFERLLPLNEHRRKEWNK